MALRQYLVQVHCCGSRWLVHVPAIDRWTLVYEKKAIEDTARLMIAAVTGAAPTFFGIDLAADRVIDGIEEFAVASTTLKRWDIPAATAGPSDAA